MHQGHAIVPLPALITRIKGEYTEMPGLRLTTAQACRLWQLDSPTCEHVMSALVNEGFLLPTNKGAFVAMPSVANPTKIGISTWRQRSA